MNISIKSSEGEVLASAPDMNLYTVADQVHKNNKIENIEKLKQEAIDAEDAKKAAETPLTEEDAHILADALLNFAIAKEEEQKEASENTTILTDEQVEEIRSLRPETAVIRQSDPSSLDLLGERILFTHMLDTVKTQRLMCNIPEPSQHQDHYILEETPVFDISLLIFNKMWIIVHLA